MKNILFGMCLIVAACSPGPQPKTETFKAPTATLVIHGGAGYMTPENLPDSLQTLYHEALNEALRVGYGILENGGQAVAAVEASIKVMEDNPLFNAGKGSVLNASGEVENDASIMDGTTLEAGAVAGLQPQRWRRRRCSAWKKTRKFGPALPQPGTNARLLSPARARRLRRALSPAPWKPNRSPRAPKSS